MWRLYPTVQLQVGTFLLLFGCELLAERCRTDDLMPSISVLCLSPSRVDPKVMGLNVLIYHSQPGGSWTTRRSPPIRWWSQRGGDDTVVVLLWNWSSQVPKKPQSEWLDLFRDWHTARDAPDCVICSMPGVLVTFLLWKFAVCCWFWVWGRAIIWHNIYYCVNTDLLLCRPWSIRWQCLVVLWTCSFCQQSQLSPG